ncbi:hypothetical protein C8R43DRAFT_1194806 [Mycena crocata]|nr:hypothetical protein C8R43DRAFT_1194806 [Mycena crocata]
MAPSKKATGKKRARSPAPAPAERPAKRRAMRPEHTLPPQSAPSKKRQRSESPAPEEPPAKRQAGAVPGPSALEAGRNGRSAQRKDVSVLARRLVPPARRGAPQSRSNFQVGSSTLSRPTSLKEEEEEEEDLRETPSLDDMPEFDENRAPAVVLPTEILATIFSLLLPPCHFLHAERRSDWNLTEPWANAMAMKRAIVRVCRSWYRAGTPFLYSEVAIRYFYQQRRLLKTLLRQPELAPLVRSISYYAEVGRTPLGRETTVHHDLGQIFALCTGLTHLKLLTRKSICHMPSFPPLPPSVTSLTISADHLAAYPWHTEQILQTGCGQLQSLHVPAEVACDRVRRLSFPQLHTLHFTLPHVAELAQCEWDMPQLRRLTLDLTRPSVRFRPSPVPRIMKPVRKFLKRDGRGAGLAFLCIAGGGLDDDDLTLDLPAECARITRLCPAVEHLVLPRVERPHPRHTPVPSVQYLDVWARRRRVKAPSREHPDPNYTVWRYCEAGVELAQWPALNGARVLDPDLETLVVDVPRAFDARERVVGTREWVGFGIVQRAGGEGGMLEVGDTRDPDVERLAQEAYMRRNPWIGDFNAQHAPENPWNVIRDNMFEVDEMVNVDGRMKVVRRQRARTAERMNAMKQAWRQIRGGDEDEDDDADEDEEEEEEEPAEEQPAATVPQRGVRRSARLAARIGDES